jgi:hypothetical protein
LIIQVLIRGFDSLSMLETATMPHGNSGPYDAR